MSSAKAVATTTQRFIDKEVTFSGRYAKSLFQSLWWAYREWRGRLFLIGALLLSGRTAILSTSLVIGYWADSLCEGSSRCRAVPGIFAGFDKWDFLTLIACLIGTGAVLSASYLALIATT